MVAPRPVAPKLSPPSTVSRSPQPKKLTKEDSHDGSTKGLCGCCDKLWSFEQDCKMERPLMIVATEEPKLEDMILEPKEKDTLQPTTRTQLSVIVLIDARSTHNFMSNKVAAHLMLQKEDYSRDKLLLKCYIPSNSPWLLMQHFQILDDFHDFPQGQTMMLQYLLDDDFRSTTQDR
ncbi:hypothetical protein GW17_00008818 [Ensete ventricosum]|nr:hypothetical protein GW17_00008818 [Ensete ventricosum]RZR81336.1 hypothetical protein BHM03_00007532 [Ensete ventricosum]